MIRWAAVVGHAALLTGCASRSPQRSAEPPGELAGKITTDAMFTHLHKLQEIADANNNTRAKGTPGYDASLAYVAQILQDKGFDVQTPEYERLDRTAGGTVRH